MSSGLSLALAAVCIVAASPAQAQAEDYPSRFIRVVVPFAPGGGSDLIARFITQRLEQSLGASFIIENKPGAGGNIGAEQGVKAPADGYTLTLIASSYTVNPALRKVGYDPVQDITPIVKLSHGPLLVLANPALGVNSIQDLVAAAKARPGEITYASSGQGSIIHAATELFNHRAGIRMTHVPYRGTAPALTDTLAGQTQIFFSSAASAMPHVLGGKLKILAVTGAQRLPSLPDVPTVREAGVSDYEVELWHGLIAPKDVPRSIVEKINKAAGDALKLKEAAEKLESDGVSPAGGTPEEFAATIAQEVELWRKLAADGVIKPP